MPKTAARIALASQQQILEALRTAQAVGMLDQFDNGFRAQFGGARVHTTHELEFRTRRSFGECYRGIIRPNDRDAPQQVKNTHLSAKA